jgi:steroid 5-alpha reductase family enzyme
VLIGLVIIVILFTIVWFVSVRLEDSSIADIAWGPGILLLALTYYITAGGAPARAGLTLALVAIWAIRLGVHLYLRNQIQGEDFRYETLRKWRGPSWWWYSYFRVFLLQAVAAWLLSIPLYFAIVSLAPDSLTVLDYVGIVVFFAGFAIEAASDEHLRRFRNDPKNVKFVLDQGLWRYSRHPNHFGEALVWWGLALIGTATGGVVGLISPALLTYYLMFASRVPLERSLLRNKRAYSHYVEITSPFLPRPPGRASASPPKGAAPGPPTRGRG